MLQEQLKYADVRQTVTCDGDSCSLWTFVTGWYRDEVKMTLKMKAAYSETIFEMFECDLCH